MNPLCTRPTGAAVECVRASRGALVTAGLVLLTLALPAGARSGPPEPLTIDQAVRFALDNSYAVEQAAARVRERTGQLAHASRLLPSNPELSVQAGTETEKATGEDADTLGLRISQELWIAGQGGLREEAARQRRRASRSELAYLKASLAARVRAAWLQTRVAGEEQRTAERLLTLTRKNRSIAQQRLDAGAAQAMDVSAATVAMGRAKAARARAESRVQQARLRLARLLSIRADQLPRLSGELEPIELALPDDDTLVRRAARRRADLEAASRRLEAARADLRLSRREVIPNLKVFGFTREIDGREEESGVGIGVELPLFHRRSGENEAARARVDQAQSRRDALLLEVRAAVREGLAAYRGARQRVSALDEEGLDSARRNVELVREAYAAGKVGSEALVTSQRQLFDVREDYLDALRDLVAAATDIERATGGLVTVSPPSSGSATDSKSNTEN